MLIQFVSFDFQETYKRIIGERKHTVQKKWEKWIQNWEKTNYIEILIYNHKQSPQLIDYVRSTIYIYSHKMTIKEN
jgi:hypothetical protein